MGGTTSIKIIRKSIHTFLQSYNHFKLHPFLALPFSLSILLLSSISHDFISLQHTIHFRLPSLFDATGIPVSSQFFSSFNLKLSQTITSTILLLPFISKNQQKYELISKKSAKSSMNKFMRSVGINPKLTKLKSKIKRGFELTRKSSYNRVCCGRNRIDQRRLWPESKKNRSPSSSAVEYSPESSRRCPFVSGIGAAGIGYGRNRTTIEAID
ncbi:unnamed protein product [Lactuca virosa]|uniref:Uncharacterized protein n=1 Tax=Lactuca virosa TaxID=75947 RepID=A0AAU9MJQ7_9ASTR|nr:unnamed protein product [Lactuca virosa]